MSFDPGRAAFYIPPGLKPWKRNLFERVGATVTAAGGRIVRDATELAELADTVVPVFVCRPELKALVAGWRSRARRFVYWDRGYWARQGLTWLPPGDRGGLWRWHLDRFQLDALCDVPEDRLARWPAPVQPWRKQGRHIVVAEPSATYAHFHSIERWTEETVAALAQVTDRPLVVRDKLAPRPLRDDLKGAHALVTHGSNAAVEAAILGTPVFVHPDSAAALVGSTDLTRIEAPMKPDREPWLRSLAYCQFDEGEMCGGAVWKMLD